MACTWVKEDDGFEAGVLVVINLQLLERQHQLIQDAHGHPAHLCQLWAVPRDDVVIAWRSWEGGMGWSEEATLGVPPTLALDGPCPLQLQCSGCMKEHPMGHAMPILQMTKLRPG